MEAVIAGLVGLSAGVVVGFVVRNTIGASNARSAEAQAKKVLLESEEEAARTRAQGLQESKDEAARMRRGYSPEIARSAARKALEIAFQDE